MAFSALFLSLEEDENLEQDRRRHLPRNTGWEHMCLMDHPKDQAESFGSHFHLPALEASFFSFYLKRKHPVEYQKGYSLLTLPATN